MLHDVSFFPTLAIYGRNPDLNLTACVSQIRSVLCIQAISQGHRQILPTPRPMRMPQSNVFRSQAFGIPGAAFFALQHDPKRTRDLLRRGAFASNGHGFVTGKPPFGSQCRTSSQSFNTIGTPRSATDLGGGFVSSTSSHLSGAWFTIQDDHHRMFSHHRH